MPSPPYLEASVPSTTLNRVLSAFILAPLLAPAAAQADLKFRNDFGHAKISEKILSLRPEELQLGLAARPSEAVTALIERIASTKEGSALLQIDPSDERSILKPESVQTTDEGITLRYQQYYIVNRKDGAQGAVPVQGGKLVAILSRDGQLEALNSGLVMLPQLDQKILQIVPSQDDSAAILALFEKAAGEAIAAKATDAASLELVRFVSSLKEHDGQIVKRAFLRAMLHWNSTKSLSYVVRHAKDQKPRVALQVQSPFGIPVVVEFEKDDSGIHVRNLGSSAHSLTAVAIHYPQWGLFTAKLEEQANPSLVATSADQVDASNESDESKAIAKNMLAALSYYRNNFKREGYDGAGTRVKVVANVKHDLLKQNAAWVGQGFQKFYFGAGGDLLSGFGFAKDVIGHEFFHAVDNHSADLVSEYQSGGIKEHAADIMGIAFDLSTRKNAMLLKDELLIGESVITDKAKQMILEKNGKHIVGLRHLQSPDLGLEDQPTDMSEADGKYSEFCVPDASNDKCGVHYMAGIPNRALGFAIRDYAIKFNDNRKAINFVAGVVYSSFVNTLRSKVSMAEYEQALLDNCEKRIVAAGLTVAECEYIRSGFTKVGVTADGSPSGSTDTSDATLEDSMKKLCAIFKEAKSQGVELELPQGCR